MLQYTKCNRPVTVCRCNRRVTGVTELLQCNRAVTGVTDVLHLSVTDLLQFKSVTELLQSKTVTDLLQLTRR